MVATLLATTKQLQEMLRHWAAGHVPAEQVGDVYVLLANAFNAAVIAFQYHNIDLRCASFRTTVCLPLLT